MGVPTSKQLSPLLSIAITSLGSPLSSPSSAVTGKNQRTLLALVMPKAAGMPPLLVA